MKKFKHKSVKKLFILLITLLSFLYYNCTSTQKHKKYKNINTKSSTINKNLESYYKIDNYKTYEVYFKLENNADCIKINISSTYITDTITHKRKTSKTYFIVEKIINLSQFKNIEKKFIFSVIGKNFDADWNRKQEITICSSAEDPIKKLDKNSVYRIRFTTFTVNNFDFNIAVHADCNIIFMDKFTY